MERDTMYLEASYRGVTGWTYSDGRRVTLKSWAYAVEALRWAKNNGFTVVLVG